MRIWNMCLSTCEEGVEAVLVSAILLYNYLTEIV